MEQMDLKWRQSAKEAWLVHCDKNCKYFHACASQQRGKNLMSSILDGEGVRRETPTSIEKAFVEHFKGILTTSGLFRIEECLHLLPVRVIAEMNRQLLGEVSSEEVSQALLQMAPIKSPSPDGFPAAFYQDHWNLVGEEVVMTVRSFFNTSIIDLEINFTRIALVLKKNNPTGVDFKPISLSNVIYKILFKVMANRLKYILPLIISCNQSAFILSQLISNNIITAYETLHTMHSRMYGKVGYMAVKLDMNNAYDRVEWSLLEEVMKKLGFESKWVQLVMKCVDKCQNIHILALNLHLLIS
jgi:hypothetical protein